MKVLIWGIPCVGKTKVSELLAKKLNYKLFNMNDIIKEKYKTIDNFHDKFSNDYDKYKEKEKIALDVINNNDNFVMTITLICDSKIVNNIIKTDTISVELIDSLESIYDRILFYDENDELIPDSKEYRDSHEEYYKHVVKNDMTTSYSEYKKIPKFDINNRKLEDIIDELSDYIIELAKKK